MKEWLMELCGGGFMPHGQCYLWEPSLVWLHALSDGLIALAYFSIPVVLLQFVRRRRDLPYPRLFLMFGAFIVACGSTHALEVWSIWNSAYYLTGGVKAVTAGVSLATAVVLVRVLPEALQLAGPGELKRLNESLEGRVQERTRDLRSANDQLRVEAEQRRQAEAEVTRLNALLQARVDELESLLKMLPVGVGIARDASCRDIRMNNELARVLDLSTAENASLSAEDSPLAGRVRMLEGGRVLAPEELPMQRAVAANGAVSGRELTVEHEDGRRVELLCAAEPLRDAEGRVAGCVATFQDVTELKSALRASARLAAIIASSEDAVVGSTLDGIVTDWNGAAERIFGYEAAEIVGRPLSIIVPADRADEDESRLAGIVVGATPRPIETQRLRKDGGVVDVSLMVSAIRDANGEMIGFSNVARDITEWKQAERRRSEFERKLQERQKLESLGVLAGGVAHDFNNLLTGILGNASLAAMSLPGASPATPFLREIEKAGGRAAELCAQMLAYASKGRFVARSVEVNRLIEDSRRLLASSAGRAKTLRLALTEALPAASGDPAQLRQALVNLVINAAEAIGTGAGEIAISTGLERVDAAALARIDHPMEMREGPYVFIEVADTGCGMDAATKGRIFEPFFSTKFTGRGLGLAAVLGIMRGHRGGVGVVSEPGKGAAFRLWLPCG